MKKIINILMLSFLLLGMLPPITTNASVTPLVEILPNGLGAVYSNLDNAIMAEDFVLTDESSINQIEIWNSLPGPVNITLDIYANTIDTSGYAVPGTNLGSYLITSSGTPEDSTICSDANYCGYRHTLDLSTPLELAAGNYWLSVYGQSDSLFDWAKSDSSTDLPTFAYKFGTSGTWSGTSQMYAFAFRLFGSQATCSSSVVVANANDSGEGSLRQAITDVCAGGTITFDESLSNQTILLDPGSQLTIDKNLTIDASELENRVTVTTDNMGRVLQVNSGTTVELLNLRITHGNVSGSGGGIYNQGQLTLVNNDLYNNISSEYGGGIYNTGNLIVNNSILTNNSAQNGGGISNNGGTLEVITSSFDQNSVSSQGGGIFNDSSGIVSVTDTTLSGNTAISTGGGIANYSGTTTIKGSTLTENQATGENASGGGLYNLGTMTVANSTLNTNAASQYGGGICNYGTMDLWNSTLSENVGHIDGYEGHGLANLESGILYYSNIIIANSPEGCACYNEATIYMSSNSIVEEDWTGGCNFIYNGDPLLGDLADNGGPTLTMALQEGSWAIDAGNDEDCSNDLVGGVDQRGVARPQGGHCDIGAFELEPDTLPPTLPIATVGFSYRQQLTAVGGTSPYSWSSIGLDLVPFSLVSDTGMLMSDDNWADPHTPGVTEFTAIWHDANGVDFYKQYSLTVSPALTFSPTALPTGKANQAYSEVVTLSGGTTPYAITVVSKPDWATPVTDPSAGTITISGAPTAYGAYTIQIEAVDSLGVKGRKTYPIWIAPERAFTWSPETPNQFEDVTFTALSDLGIPNMTWYSGENCEDYLWVTGNTFNRTFNESGDHYICLQYWVDSINDFVRDKQLVPITNIPPIDVHIDFDPEPALFTSPVFVRITFLDSDTGPFTCTIDWGDGTVPQTMPTSSYQRCEFPNHTYAAPGTYTTSGYVTEDGVGSTAPITVNLEVLDPASLPPFAWDHNWLVSNTGSSRIILEAYDLQGTEDLIFAIVDTPPSAIGSLGTPIFQACEYDQYGSGSRVCWAVVDFTPADPTYTGDTFFTFTASDAGVTSDPAQINLHVAPNEAPTANAKSLTVPSNIPTTFTLTGTDPDVVNWIPDHLTIEVTTPPTQGTLKLPHQADYQTDFNPGTGDYDVTYYWLVEYTPNGTPADTDSFVFQVTDNNLHTSSATVDLTLRDPVTWHVNAFDDNDDGACDSTHCSLREAVFYAFSGDTIDFAGLTGLPGEIVLGGESIRINKHLTITGPGADLLAVSGGADIDDPEPWFHSRVFTVSDYESPVNVTISGLTIKDGRDTQGGGVSVTEGSTLTMNDCVIGPNNIVTYAGGGIFNERATLNLNRCTVTGNEGTGSLGGAGVTTAGGGATTTIINSTISGNITNNYGGGIYVGYDGLVNLIHTTISGNISNENYQEPGEERGGGAGIFIDIEGRVQLKNTIVAGNTDMTDPATAGHEKWPDVYGEFTSLGGNLIGDPTGSTNTWATNDLVGTVETPLDPKLGALLKNDPGKTLTMALLTDSPAIDAVACPEGINEDQRGVERPQGSACDIGAYELEQIPVDGDLKISKTFDPLASGFAGTFAIHYDCDDGAAHDGTVNLAAGGSQTITGIPIGTQCTITEPTTPTPPTGWSFGTPTFNPVNGTVTISGSVAEVTVTNTISRDLGKLKISKVFDPLTSGFNGTFTIHYNCDDGTAHDGTVNLAAGGSQIISGIPTGTQCTITESTTPTPPTGWSFGTPTYKPQNGMITVIEQGKVYQVTVTNSISLDASLYQLFLPLIMGD